MLITDPLPRSFTSRFGILVPNTNYPPGLDYRYSSWTGMTLMGETDVRMIFIDLYCAEIAIDNMERIDL